jgi:hypothetical protein
MSRPWSVHPRPRRHSLALLEDCQEETKPFSETQWHASTHFTPQHEGPTSPRFDLTLLEIFPEDQGNRAQLTPCMISGLMHLHDPRERI